ncbi:MAG: CPXCG motif-containing cysteine-rich protein [Candidatus Thiodiazotropha sp.]
MLSTHIDCPYCGEPIELTLDTSLPQQAYIEDCSVCCRPISLQLTCAPGQLLDLSARREDEC